MHAFGPDAVTITDISVVKNDLAVETRRGDLLELEDLLKRPVMTDSGTRLGHVGAIQFGDASHRLTRSLVPRDDTVGVRCLRGTDSAF